MEPVLFRGKIVGYRDMANKVYITKRNPDKHFYRIGQGYPISVDVIQQLMNSGIDKIRMIIELKNGTVSVYEVLLQEYQTAPEHIFDGDRQRCVPLREMTRVDNKNGTLNDY